MPVSRRRLLFASLGASVPAAAWSQPLRPLPNDALRVGVDAALFESGLATALQQGFSRDIGITVRLVPRPVLPMLEALERGELDAALANAPAAEMRLMTLGLAHDRQPIAAGEFVIVGPAPRGKARDAAGIAGGRDAAAAFAALRAASLAVPGAATFLSAADGSGTHVLEQALWREARIAPAPPWHMAAEAGSDLITQARTRGDYALVERGAWLALGGAPLAVLVESDPRLAEAVHAMRAFRATHAAAKIFVAWIAGPRGRRIVAGRPGYRVPGA